MLRILDRVKGCSHSTVREYFLPAAAYLHQQGAHNKARRLYQRHTACGADSEGIHIHIVCGGVAHEDGLGRVMGGASNQDPSHPDSNASLRRRPDSTSIRRDRPHDFRQVGARTILEGHE